MDAAASTAKSPKTRDARTNRLSRTAPRNNEAMSATATNASAKLITRKKLGDRLASSHAISAAKTGRAARRTRLESKTGSDLPGFIGDGRIGMFRTFYSTAALNPDLQALI